MIIPPAIEKQGSQYQPYRSQLVTLQLAQRKKYNKSNRQKQQYKFIGVKLFKNYSKLDNLFNIKGFWFYVRMIGFIFVNMIYFNIGPEIIIGDLTEFEISQAKLSLLRKRKQILASWSVELVMDVRKYLFQYEKEDEDNANNLISHPFASYIGEYTNYISQKYKTRQTKRRLRENIKIRATLFHRRERREHFLPSGMIFPQNAIIHSFGDNSRYGLFHILRTRSFKVGTDTLELLPGLEHSTSCFFFTFCRICGRDVVSFCNHTFINRFLVVIRQVKVFCFQ